MRYSDASNNSSIIYQNTGGKMIHMYSGSVFHKSPVSLLRVFINNLQNCSVSTGSVHSRLEGKHGMIFALESKLCLVKFPALWTMPPHLVVLLPHITPVLPSPTTIASLHPTRNFVALCVPCTPWIPLRLRPKKHQRETGDFGWSLSALPSLYF